MHDHQPEVTEASAAWADGHQHVLLLLTSSHGQPGPLDPDPARGAELRVVPVAARQGGVPSSHGKHGLWLGVHIQLHTTEMDC